MVNIGIRDNDLAIIERADSARNGEIVVTFINSSLLF